MTPKESRKKYRETHKEQISLYRKKYNLAHKEQLQINKKKIVKDLRELVLNHYGNKCVCCGETQYEFLAIDHIDNNGAEHKRINKISGHGFYYWLKRNNFPDGFQVLCHNCNQAKGLYGICPHQKLG